MEGEVRPMDPEGLEGRPMDPVGPVGLEGLADRIDLAGLFKLE